MTISLRSRTDRPRGFTLIEVMITLAILAILLGIAISSYQNYSIRAQATECLTLAAPAKLAVTEAASTEKQLPSDQQAANIDASQVTDSPYCDGLDYDGTRIRVQIDESAVGAPASSTIEFNLEPRLGGDTVRWRCSAGNTSADAVQYLPAGCRDS